MKFGANRRKAKTEEPLHQKMDEGAFMDKGAEHVDPDVPQKPVDDFHTASDMQGVIFVLCRLLSKKTSDGKFECEAWIAQLESYLAMSAGRLMYSSISNYIFDKSEQELTTFETNIDFVLHYMENKVLENPKSVELKRTYKAVLKFYDHSNLAIQQQKLVTRNRLDLEHEVEGILAPKISDITKDMTSQLVSMIGIFTALSFIVFGGISSLDNIFKAAQETLKSQGSVLPLLIIAVAWALCMMNLLFGFMYFIIRITRLPKPVDEKAANLVQRYPVVFLCDYILLTLLVLFCGMWFAKTAGIGKGIYNDWVNNDSDKIFKYAIGIFVVAFTILGILLWRWYKPKKKRAEQETPSDDTPPKE